MNLAKIQICKEILDVSKDAYNKHKQKQGSGPSNSSSSYGHGYGPPGYGPPGYGPPGYGPSGYGPASCHCQCQQGGRTSGGPMQFISSIKNSKQLKSLPQTLQAMASSKHGGGHGGAKKILPQVLKGIKSRIKY